MIMEEPVFIKCKSEAEVFYDEEPNEEVPSYTQREIKSETVDVLAKEETAHVTTREQDIQESGPVDDFVLTKVEHNLGFDDESIKEENADELTEGTRKEVYDVSNARLNEIQPSPLFPGVHLDTSEKMHVSTTTVSSEEKNTEHTSVEIGGYHPSGGFSCVKCGRTFRRRRNLILHLYVHAEHKPHSCSTCGKNFSRIDNYTRHLVIHTRDKPFSCSNCDKSFRERRCLVQHLLTHTGEKPLLCTTCGKRFRQHFALKCHIRTHTGERPHCCSTCGRKFALRSNLASHEMTHSLEQAPSCNTCGKSYASKRNLARHLLVHNGDRPFVSICEKTIRRSVTNTNPRLIHTKEKPYICETCGCSFSRRYCLINHIRLHTGEKPYSCNFCSKVFSQRAYLNRHKANIHKDENGK